MPVDSTHAFAGGPVYGRPRPRGRLRFRRPGVIEARVAEAWRSFDAGAVVGDGVRLGPSAWCWNTGPRERIALGEASVCRGLVRRETFGDGTIVVGDRVYIGDDCIISCSDRIAIGDRVMIGHGVQLFDNNSHPLTIAERIRDADAVLDVVGDRGDIDHAPIEIGADAWIGFGVIVLKGVRIGAGSVVAAGSVVTGDIPPGVVAAGNPARVVRELA